MRIHRLALAAALSLPPFAAQAAVIIPEQFATISPQLQSQILIQETTATSSYGIRQETVSPTVRAVQQTFTWSSSANLTGIGVKLAANSNNINTTSPVPYELRLFSVSSINSGATVGSLINAYQFSLTGDYTTSTDYLYFPLSSPVSLTLNGAYMFEMVPMSAAVKRLTIANANGGTKTYAGGNGFAYNSDSTTAPSTVGNGSVNNQTFFATVPEPSAVGLVGVGSLVLVGCAAKNLRRRQV